MIDSYRAIRLIVSPLSLGKVPARLFRGRVGLAFRMTSSSSQSILVLTTPGKERAAFPREVGKTALGGMCLDVRPLETPFWGLSSKKMIFLHLFRTAGLGAGVKAVIGVFRSDLSPLDLLERKEPLFQGRSEKRLRRDVLGCKINRALPRRNVTQKMENFRFLREQLPWRPWVARRCRGSISPAWSSPCAFGGESWPW